MDRQAAMDKIDIVYKILQDSRQDFKSCYKVCSLFIAYIVLNLLMYATYNLYIMNSTFIDVKAFNTFTVWQYILLILFACVGLTYFITLKKKNEQALMIIFDIWILLPLLFETSAVIKNLISLANPSIASYRTAVEYNIANQQGRLLLLSLLFFVCCMATSLVTKNPKIKKCAFIFLLLSNGCYIFENHVVIKGGISVTLSGNYIYLYLLELIFTVYICLITKSSYQEYI